MESMLSVKGKKLLIVKKYTFGKDKETKLGVSYKCTRRGCKATIGVDKSETVLLKSKSEHNHTPSDHLDVKKLQNGLKRKATEDICINPSKLINNGIRGEGYTFNVSTTDVDHIRRSIYRARRSILPPLPKCISDVHSVLKVIQCVKNKGEPFLLLNNEDSQIILYSCHSNLKYLCSRDSIYCDGTFNYCPKFVVQFFTVHAVDNGHYIPLAFFVLPDKRASTYATAFKLLKDYCYNNLNLDWKLCKVICDFEKAIHTGIRQIWPDILIIGCRFHLIQSWLRKIQNLGLISEYKNENSEIGKWLHYTFGILFLESTEVAECFCKDLIPIMPFDERLTSYTLYMINTYTSDTSDLQCGHRAQVPQNARQMLVSRSTKHFNSAFYSAHPDIFKFVDVILDIQLNTVKLNSTHYT